MLSIALKWIQILHVPGRRRRMRGWEIKSQNFQTNWHQPRNSFQEPWMDCSHCSTLSGCSFAESINFNLFMLRDKYGAVDDFKVIIIRSQFNVCTSTTVLKNSSPNVYSWIHFWCLSSQLIDENWKIVLDLMSAGGSLVCPSRRNKMFNV